LGPCCGFSAGCLLAGIHPAGKVRSGLGTNHGEIGWDRGKSSGDREGIGRSSAVIGWGGDKFLVVGCG